MRSHHPRVFVSSTKEDLDLHRQVVREVLLELQCHPVMWPEYQCTGEPLNIPMSIRRALATCSAFVLVQAFRRGWVPTPREGGDGKSSIVELELAAAKERGLPIYAFLAKESWPGELWEHEARQQVMEFRKGIARPTKLFSFEEPLDAQGAADRLPMWASVVRGQLAGGLGIHVEPPGRHYQADEAIGLPPPPTSAQPPNRSSHERVIEIFRLLGRSVFPAAPSLSLAMIVGLTILFLAAQGLPDHDERRDAGGLSIGSPVSEDCGRPNVTRCMPRWAMNKLDQTGGAAPPLTIDPSCQVFVACHVSFMDSLQSCGDRWFEYNKCVERGLRQGLPAQEQVLGQRLVSK